MFGPELGAVFLVSPTHDILGWTLLVLGLVVGFNLRVHDVFQYPCIGAMVYSIHRDFGIPLEVVLFASMPIFLLKWNYKSISFLTVAWVVNYLMATDIHPPRDSYVPGVAAALYVASSQSKLHAVAIVLARHLVPRAVYVLYGVSFFHAREFEIPYYDHVAGKTLVCVLFGMMAMAWWYVYFLAAAGVLCCLMIYI